MKFTYGFQSQCVEKMSFKLVHRVMDFHTYQLMGPSVSNETCGNIELVLDNFSFDVNDFMWLGTMF